MLPSHAGRYAALDIDMKVFHYAEDGGKIQGAGTPDQSLLHC